jgi:formiminotetrahydrofolate cyclodeaminase
MPLLVDTPLQELLAAFASPTPAPAGGSASALAAAIGTALLAMSATLPRTRSGSDEDRQLLNEASLGLTRLRHQLTEAVDRDAAAYGQVVSARGAGLQQAMKAAIEVPLQVMRWSSEALQAAPVVAARCHRPASSDVRVGVGLLQAGFAGARSSALDNLRRITDERYVDAARTDIDRLTHEANAAIAAAQSEP